MFWRGWVGYEPETSPLFYSLARGSSVIVDVGAYVGFYTVLAAHANPGGRVLALEPLPAAYRRLVANVGRNGVSNVDCVPCAAGAEEGSAQFHFQDTSLTQDLAGIPCSSSLSREFMSRTAGLTSASVRVRRLDSLLGELAVGRVCLMKIDTETTEPDVLLGMGERLHRDRPDVVCEVLAEHDTGARLASLLAPAGYRYYHLTPEGPQERASIDGHPNHLNYLFSTRAVGEIQGAWHQAREIARAARKDIG